MRIYVIRHADPDYENNTITPAGHLEAQALAERLRAEGITHIYTSPLGRARHTMQYTSQATGLDGVVLDWTQELAGLAMDLPNQGREMAWDIHGETVRTMRPLPTHDDWHTRPPLDDPRLREAFETVQAASDAFLAEHGYVREGRRYRIGRPNRDRLAVFTHAGLGLTWLAHLLDLPLPLAWAALHPAPSSVTIVLMDERTPQYACPRCLAFGDTSHLYHASLPVQPRGTIANWD